MNIFDQKAKFFQTKPHKVSKNDESSTNYVFLQNSANQN